MTRHIRLDMAVKSKFGAQILMEQTRKQRIVNAFFAFALTFFGYAAIVGFLLEYNVMSPSPSIEGVLISLAVFSASTVALLSALYRNRIVRFIFEHVSRSTFLSITFIGRIVHFTVCLVAVVLFALGSVQSNFLGSISLVIFFLYSPIYIIFSEPFAENGETRILFQQLDSSLTDYEGRQQWLRKISKRVEKHLRIANIKVPHNEFVFYFNMELLKGMDVQNYLRDIESWLVEKKTSCFEALSKIYPEEKFESCTRTSFSHRVAQNPTTTIKYISLVIIALVYFVANPSLVNEILNLFGLV